MKKVLYSSLILCLFSCRKGCKEGSMSLRGTQWNLYFKNNSTFTFYAQSEIFFKEDNTLYNYRNFDTLMGSWSEAEMNVLIEFDNGDVYSGKQYSTDSLSGTLTASGNSGDWYALRK